MATEPASRWFFLTARERELLDNALDRIDARSLAESLTANPSREEVERIARERDELKAKMREG